MLKKFLIPKFRYIIITYSSVNKEPFRVFSTIILPLYTTSNDSSENNFNELIS